MSNEELEKNIAKNISICMAYVPRDKMNKVRDLAKQTCDGIGLDWERVVELAYVYTARRIEAEYAFRKIEIRRSLFDD